MAGVRRRPSSLLVLQAQHFVGHCLQIKSFTPPLWACVCVCATFRSDNKERHVLYDSVCSAMRLESMDLWTLLRKDGAETRGIYAQKFCGAIRSISVTQIGIEWRISIGMAGKCKYGWSFWCQHHWPSILVRLERNIKHNENVLTMLAAWNALAFFKDREPKYVYFSGRTQYWVARRNEA